MTSGFGLYWPGQSFLHRMDPRGKLLVFLIAAAAVFWKPYFFSACLVLLLFLAVGKRAGLPLPWLFSGFSAFLLIFIFAAFSFLWRHGGAGKMLLMGGRMAVLLCGANLLALTTSPSQIGEGLRKVFGGSFGFMAILAFRFFPLLEEERVKITRAQILRGIPLESGSILQRVKAYPALLIPLFILSFRKAEEISSAMMLRAGSPPFAGKPLKAIRWKLSDTLLLAGFAAVIALLFLLPPRLPALFRYPSS